MRLTKRQERRIAKRYYNEGESFFVARQRKGFHNLGFGQWAMIIRDNAPLFKGVIPPSVAVVPKKGAVLAFEFKKGGGTHFMNLTEDEMIEFRRNVPIPEETIKLFEAGRGYKNELKWKK